MPLGCDMSAEDLLLYVDGVLGGARGELAEAHLRACPTCRRWMADFAQAERLLRDGSPPIDDPNGRAALRARLLREAGRGRRHPRPLPVAAAILLALLLVGLTLPAPLGARPGLGRFVRFAGGPGRPTAIVGAVPIPGSPAVLPFVTRQPAALPLGLRLLGRATPGGERLDLDYRNDRGLVVRLGQERIEDVDFTLETRRGRLVVIGTTEVLWQPDPWPESVAALTWEDRGVLYNLVVLESPAGGLPFSDARQIVEALVGR